MISERPQEIDGVSDWRWVTEDQGAWKGPMEDWLNSHKRTYMEHVRKFDVVIQAGGNCGMYPRLFSNYFKWVYTFEPDPINFMALTLNCQRDNIVKMQAALGDVHAMVEVHRHTLHNVGMHQVKQNPGAHVPQLRIDDLALQDCDLIQLDIEGYEINALRGAIETITKFRPVVVVENNTVDIKNYFDKLKYTVASTSHMDTIYRPL
jgi:FkbM family methyltransferase